MAAKWKSRPALPRSQRGRCRCGSKSGAPLGPRGDLAQSRSSASWFLLPSRRLASGIHGDCTVTYQASWGETSVGTLRGVSFQLAVDWGIAWHRKLEAYATFSNAARIVADADYCQHQPLVDRRRPHRQGIGKDRHSRGQTEGGLARLMKLRRLETLMPNPVLGSPGPGALSQLPGPRGGRLTELSRGAGLGLVKRMSLPESLCAAGGQLVLSGRPLIDSCIPPAVEQWRCRRGRHGCGFRST